MPSLKIAIVVARFNQDITAKLLDGALKKAQEAALPKENIDIFWVPGAFELPLIAKKLTETNQYDAIVCLGAVLQGETKHFDYVCMGVTQGIMQVNLNSGVPTLFGVLTADRSQAEARSVGDRNKGAHAMSAALEMIETCKQIENSEQNLLQ